MIRAYHRVEEGDHDPGFIAPIIPLNPYGNVRVLKKYGLIETYTDLFEQPKYSFDARMQLYMNPDVARFFWGEGGYVPTIDEMNRDASREPLRERPCAVRFAIGAIMFKRDFWEFFGQYPVPVAGFFGRNIAGDEIRLCSFCVIQSRPAMVTENVVVGHLAFMPQNAAMKEYYMDHPERFLPPETTGGDNTSL